jgi:succinate dehydrogenase/fumarate reductase-like Fe-S protein
VPGYDACPHTGKAGGMHIGPLAVARAAMINEHPLGRNRNEKRLESIMESDGLPKCGEVPASKRVCHEKAPLIRLITRANREIIKQSLHKPGFKKEC